jgi:hydroxylaminobenzene mutase
VTQLALLARQGHRLLQLGVGLLLVTSFEGFAIPYMASPPLGRSFHTLTSLLAVLLMALGLLWPRLKLGTKSARLAFWLLVYSGLAIDFAFLLAAVWGAGNTTMPLAAGSARGTAGQEMAILIISYSSGPTGIAAFGLIFWGLRLGPSSLRDTLSAVGCCLTRVEAVDAPVGRKPNRRHLVTQP